jgi:outer membrane autotransporter protein
MQDGTTLRAAANNLALSNEITLTGADTIDAQANAFTLSGAISGTGSLTKIGAGAVTLTGANAYSGGTQLDAGTLAVGNSAALGTGPLTMLDGTVLQFTASGLNLANAIIFPGVDPTIDTGANNDTISGIISGTGGLTKIGSGSLDLTATSTYTGVTTISAGTLVVDGSIASSSSLTIAAGATLGGSGVVPSFVVPSGASVAPGALTSYSTLKVAGTLGFLSGSTYVVEVNAAGASDKIATTGAATLSGGTVNVVASGGNYSTANRYTILTAGGGVTGGFGSLTTTSNLAFLSPTLSYDANDAYLGFAQTAAFPSVAVTPNQAATATAIQALGSGAPIYKAVVGQSVAGARQAFDALSGEIHASTVSAAFDDTRLPREAVLDRLASPYGTLPAGGAAGFAAMNAIAGPSVPANVFAGWGQTFGSFGHIGGDGNAATLDRSMGGFILGLDATFDNRYRLGVGAGYTQSTLSSAARGSSGQVASTYGGVYGGASLNALQLSGGALYAFNHYGTNRSVAFPGFTDVDGAGYGGDTLQAFGEAGWRVPLSGLAGPTFVEPIAGLTAMHIATAGFTESGGAAALTSASQGYDYAVTMLGVRAEATLFANVPLTARGMVGWTHVFGDVTPTSTLAFESAPSIPFNTAGAPVARDALAIEAGFDWKLTNNATVGVFYSGSLGNRDQDNAIKGKLEAAF